MRVAFGAEHGRIFRMVVVQGLRLSAAGIVAGMPAAWALAGLMRTMLVGVEPTDPLTFTGMAAGFLVITAVACGVPVCAPRGSIRWWHYVRNDSDTARRAGNTIPAPAE